MDGTPLRQRPTRCDRALDRDPFRLRRNPARCRPPPQESARRLCQCHQLVEGARLVRKNVPRYARPKCNGTPARLALLFALALSGCTTFKPPQISFDDDVPPPPELPMPADDHARPLHVPPSWTPARGGKKGDEEAKEPAARITTANDVARVSRGGQGISMPSRSFPTVPARSIRSTPHQGRSRISRSSQANS